MTYKILLTDEFGKQVRRLTKEHQRQIDKIIEKIKINPYVGKPIKYDYFREKKIGEVRLYYLIYSDVLVVYVLGISGKKDQQEKIDNFIENLPMYYEEIRKSFGG